MIEERIYKIDEIIKAFAEFQGFHNDKQKLYLNMLDGTLHDSEQAVPFLQNLSRIQTSEAVEFCLLERELRRTDQLDLLTEITRGREDSTAIGKFLT